LTGTFQNIIGSSSCKICPIGFSNGATKEEESCTSCDEGKFQDRREQANCKGMPLIVTAEKNGSNLELIWNWCAGVELMYLFIFLFSPLSLSTSAFYFLKLQQIAQQDCTRLKLVPSPAVPALDAQKVDIRRPLV
jgi:hypothetical protein